MIVEWEAKQAFEKWLKRNIIHEPTSDQRSLYWSAFMAGIDAALIAEKRLPPRDDEDI